MESVYVVFPEKEQIEVAREPVTPPAAGQVLCKAEKSLISIGTESFCLRGIFDPGTNWEAWVKYPFRPGYSMAGKVVQIGAGVNGVQVGDRLAAWVPHQQYFTLGTEDIYPIPDGVSDEEAVWAILATTTQLAVRRAQLQLGETVGVIGLGILGQLVVQYLVLSGAQKIIAIDPVQSRLDLAGAHGATHLLPMDVVSARAEVEKITGGKMLDVVFDVTGHPAVLAPAVQLLRRLGRVILLGDTPTPTQQHLGPGVVSNSISILGIHATARPLHGSEFSPWGAHEMVDLFFAYLLQRRMQVADLITHRYSPSDAPRVYESLRRDRSPALGVLFDWTELTA